MNISQVFKENGLIYNRHLFSTLQLPYSYEDIKIQANDTITSELLNLKIGHLFDNFLYLYQSSIIASNIIPVSSTAMAGVTSYRENFSWHYSVSATQFVPLTSIPSFNKTKEMILIKNNDIDQYSAVYTSGSALNIFNFDTSTSLLTSVYTQNVVVPSYNVPFGDITAFTLASSYLFVLDNALNRVIKYDASGFTTNDPIRKNKLFFVNSIGNLGTFNSKSEFNNPKSIASYLNDIYVLDSGNKSVKIYDINLNWKQTSRLYVDFLSSFPIDIKCDAFGSVYILTDNNKLLIYKDNSFQEKRIISLDSLNDSEEFKRLVFSKFDSNVFYIYSNKNVYKKFVSSPDQTVGKYLLYLFKYDSNEVITAFDSAASYNGDRNLLFSYSVPTTGTYFSNLLHGPGSSASNGIFFSGLNSVGFFFNDNYPQTIPLSMTIYYNNQAVATLTFDAKRLGTPYKFVLDYNYPDSNCFFGNFIAGDVYYPNNTAPVPYNIAGKFGNFFDNLNLFDILAERDFDIYSLDDINFEKEEYMQSWILNKSLAMLLLNHMRFRDQIIGKFIASRDSRNNVIFKGTRYLLPDELDNLYFDNDITQYVGVNEIVASNIINRPLKKLYSIQEKLLSILGAEIQNAPDVNTIITIN